ncbi:MAG TPA: hypothetical protein ENI27_09555 [bacterium]|nr:hypothetical protein [bacterium]
MGIGGQVFNIDDEPVIGLVVEVGGMLEDNDVVFLNLTGSSPKLGPGGFVITLADHVTASQGTLWLQMFDLSGTSQSSKLYFDTYEDCDRNLILINFQETVSPPVYRISIPLVYK